MTTDLLLQTKPCIACSESISRDAVICSKCKEYQHRWRNELKFWAGIAGLIVLISSGLAFSFGSFKFARDYFRPPDLVISEINTFGKMTFVNLANQSAWIKELRIRSDKPQHDLQWDINHVLGPRQLYAVDVIELSKAQFRGLSQQVFGARQGVYARNLSSTIVGEVLRSMHRDKYVPVFLHREGPEYRVVQDYLKSQATILECSAQLSYTFVESQSARFATIPCVGVVKERSDERAVAEPGI